MTEQPAGLGYRSPEWVAEQLDVDKTTVYRYLREGTLPALQLGKKWLISEQALRTFLTEEQEKQTVRRKVITWLVNRYEAWGAEIETDDGDRIVDDIYGAARSQWSEPGEPPPNHVWEQVRRGEIQIHQVCPDAKPNERVEFDPHVTYVVYLGTNQAPHWRPYTICSTCDFPFEDGEEVVSDAAQKTEDP